MNKLKTIALLGLIPAFSVQSSCEYKDQLILQMDVITSNIANANTTRTPSGGPYKKKYIYCSVSGCVINEDSDFKSIYEPKHMDADQNGTVLYPNIDTVEEMENLIKLQELYEQLPQSCLAK
jgi:flagellar basal body rod protein FlgC